MRYGQKSGGFPDRAVASDVPAARLRLYGQNTYGTNCGSNPFVGFTQTQVNCPSGLVCVTIDPNDGDDGRQRAAVTHQRWRERSSTSSRSISVVE